MLIHYQMIKLPKLMIGWFVLISIIVIDKKTQSLLPLLPPDLLVESVGHGVTSSILPILRPFLARALIADWAPGPGVFDETPPLPLNLI